jgi:hypothetical protein
MKEPNHFMIDVTTTEMMEATVPVYLKKFNMIQKQ